tara:strand:+ start:1631 stop:2236 length:606 start_codon:yes stop_codon:yes gene_type:complete
MSQIKLLHSGGNGVILAAPSSNPAADRTLTLPGDADGTIATTANAGKILQVIQTVKKDRTTIQSTTLVDIAGMSVTITPSSSSNKVLIRYCVSAFTNNQYWSMRLLRGSDSTIFIGDQNPSATSQNRGSFGSYMSSYVDGRSVTQELLDSPNTTSATTYKLQAHSPYSSSYIIGINSSPTLDNYTYMTNCVSTITAMEVAA